MTPRRGVFKSRPPLPPGFPEPSTPPSRENFQRAIHRGGVDFFWNNPMPKARRTSYALAFKLKVIAEAEAVENNSEIARDYGINESMVHHWRRDQGVLRLFNGELKMSARRKTMGRYSLMSLMLLITY